MKFLKNRTQAHPFIKWVGGKTQLLEEVRKSLPDDFSSRQHITYVEPFVGGGAVMFWILQEYSNIERAVVNDINAELICTYRVVRENVDALINRLSEIQSEYIPLDSQGRKSYYMEKRTLFNNKRISALDIAALFIFLNRTCFNGLYRVNSKGEFNVPHGKYANPRICDEANLRACSDVLHRVEILCGDFAETGNYASENTLFYFDPPYKPITATSSFTSYSKECFDDAEQIRLRDFCNKISAEKSLFIASNSDPKDINPNDNFFDAIYDDFVIRRVSATRMVNSDIAGRGSVSEIMISNIAQSK